MGLHRDGDEETFAAPVASLSLGDSAVFRIGGADRTDPTTSLRLPTGDGVVPAGPSRRVHNATDPEIGSAWGRDNAGQGGRMTGGRGTQKRKTKVRNN